ncbi:hypothetical protein RRG08_050302 [Elysia crispata]|uniref:Uncharacterized protein n=1 Tax=Elysia crispata TaxID=231223 RepID=A0AAE1DPB5_9GAST|nr:hypothetical protein RRG08_050302 [Elysia crispata]
MVDGICLPVLPGTIAGAVLPGSGVASLRDINIGIGHRRSAVSTGPFPSGHQSNPREAVAIFLRILGGKVTSLKSKHRKFLDKSAIITVSSDSHMAEYPLLGVYLVALLTAREVCSSHTCTELGEPNYRLADAQPYIIKLPSDTRI